MERLSLTLDDVHALHLDAHRGDWPGPGRAALADPPDRATGSRPRTRAGTSLTHGSPAEGKSWVPPSS